MWAGTMAGSMWGSIGGEHPRARGKSAQGLRSRPASEQQSSPNHPVPERSSSGARLRTHPSLLSASSSPPRPGVFCLSCCGALGFLENQPVRFMNLGMGRKVCIDPVYTEEDLTEVWLDGTEKHPPTLHMLWVPPPCLTRHKNLWLIFDPVPWKWPQNLDLQAVGSS